MTETQRTETRGTDVDLARAKIKKYLQDLAAALGSLPKEQSNDIVEELRSHIVEKSAANFNVNDDMNGTMTPASVDAVLAGLGAPESLARLYVADDLQIRALKSRSPVLIIRTLFRWASLSFAGFSALVASIIGYSLSLSLIICGLLRPIHPRTAGLFRIPDGANDYSVSLRLGFTGLPPGSHDLLGLWIIPIGVMAGLGLFLLTSLFALWSIRRLRRATPALSRRDEGDAEVSR
ncbi:MAG TPA: hypothetical protein VKR59_09795 [Terriglobales bacterium]|nr:hypothetical protein [Terriglobales bacterium]